MSRSLLAACLLAASHAWVAPAATPRISALAAKRKGFGDDKFSKTKPKTAAKVEKERAASAYDAAKASGVPEYRVYVKPGGTEDWAPVGCVTVPRSESVPQSIYGNLESLKSATLAPNNRLSKGPGTVASHAICDVWDDGGDTAATRRSMLEAKTIVFHLFFKQ